MKESRNLIQNHLPGNLTDKSQAGHNKSNISSLKAILNQGRVPLSQYINEKSFKSDNNNQNLSYFDKIKAMFNKGSQIKTLRKDEKSNNLEMDVQSYTKDANDGEQNSKFSNYLNHYANDKINNYHKKRLDANQRYKERSKSMNGKSRPKMENVQRIQTLSSKIKKQMDVEGTEKTHHKAYTQHEIQQQDQKIAIPFVPKFKELKKQIVNYTKFTAIYTNNSLENGIIQLQQTLGCGANAIVRIGKQKKTGQLFAVKIYEKYKLIEPIKKKRVLREIQILSKIDHQNIIKIQNCYQDKRQIHILFQFIPNAQTLQDFIRNNHSVDSTLKNHISLKIVQAINYLHNNGISHRDIKTDNVMIGENTLVKLIDFGFATTVVKGETHCGTPNYMAPELFCKKSVYNPFKVDVWALGILLYYLYQGCYPFRGYNQKQLSRNISVGSFSFKKCDNKIREVISSALKSDPNNRISADELLALIKNITIF